MKSKTNNKIRYSETKYRKVARGRIHKKKDE
jgi:hypothetical protein